MITGFAAADRFDIDPYIALACTGGSVLGLFQLLDARPGMDAGTATDQLAASLLRMFGLPVGEARRIATQPLPAIA